MEIFYNAHYHTLVMQLGKTLANCFISIFKAQRFYHGLVNKHGLHGIGCQVF